MAQTPAPRFLKPLLAAAVALLLGGAAVALVQPGDLGDDDVDSEGAQGATTTSAPVDPGASTTAAPGATVTTAGGQQVTTTTQRPIPGATTTTAAGGSTTVTTAAGQGTGSTTTATTGGSTATTAATTGTTAPGSGLGTSGDSRADDGTAETGIESMLGPGLALAASAGLLRRAGRRRA